MCLECVDLLLHICILLKSMHWRRKVFSFVEIFQVSVSEPVLIFSGGWHTEREESVWKDSQIMTVLKLKTNQLPYLRSKSTSLWTYTVINLPSTTKYINTHCKKEWQSEKITRADTTLVTVIKHYVLEGTLCQHELGKTLDNYVALINIMFGHELTDHGGRPGNAADEPHQQWPEHVLLFPGWELQHKDLPGSAGASHAPALASHLKINTSGGNSSWLTCFINSVLTITW